MNNKIIVLITAFLLSFSIYSQAPRGFYAKALVNNTSFKSKDMLADAAIGYGVGINFNFGYHETYNYQIEVMYNKNSMNFKSVDQSYAAVYDSKYNYTALQTGFYLNYYVLKPDEDAFFIGPQVGGSLTFGGSFSPAKDAGSNGEYYLPYLIDQNSFTNDTPKMLVNVGLGITGGYNRFRFDLRYDLGLTNVLQNVQTDSYDANNNYTGPSLSGKMNNISFGISYNIWALTKK